MISAQVAVAAAAAALEQKLDEKMDEKLEASEAATGGQLDALRTLVTCAEGKATDECAALSEALAAAVAGVEERAVAREAVKAGEDAAAFAISAWLWSIAHIAGLSGPVAARCSTARTIPVLLRCLQACVEPVPGLRQLLFYFLDLFSGQAHLQEARPEGPRARAVGRVPH